MPVSTKSTAKEMERFISNPGMEILLPWMTAITASLTALAEVVDTNYASLAALAAVVDTDRGTDTDGVDALTATDAADSITVEE